MFLLAKSKHLVKYSSFFNVFKYGNDIATPFCFLFFMSFHLGSPGLASRMQRMNLFCRVINQYPVKLL